jgi:hypothetical protein
MDSRLRMSRERKQRLRKDLLNAGMEDDSSDEYVEVRTKSFLREQVSPLLKLKSCYVTSTAA